ncbi:hypothetical protein RYX36_034809 [Vicia faba]
MNNRDSTPDNQDQALKNSITDANNNIVNSLVTAEDVSGKGKSGVVQQIQRKRSSKRDRHSKRKKAEGICDDVAVNLIGVGKLRISAAVREERKKEFVSKDVQLTQL